MTRAETRRQTTRAAIAEILEIEVATLDDGARLREDLGMDSLGSLELLSTLSEKLRIDLEVDEAMKIVTVDDACVFVEDAYVAQRGDEPGNARA